MSSYRMSASFVLLCSEQIYLEKLFQGILYLLVDSYARKYTQIGNMKSLPQPTIRKLFFFIKPQVRNSLANLHSHAISCLAIHLNSMVLRTRDYKS
jgi:hypothetical protein